MRRKPSNASEKEPTQKKKVRSIFVNSLRPSLCSLNPLLQDSQKWEEPKAIC